MNKKVYCGECKFFEVIKSKFDKNFEMKYCKNSKNKFDTHRYKTYITKLPNEINKNNDCEWFEPIDE